MSSVSTPFRAVSASRRSQWLASLRAMLGGAAIFFVYEAGKSAVLPDLTIWESHSITIGFGALIAGGAAWIAMRRHGQLLEAVASEEARRQGLELRQRALQESEARYRVLVERSPEAIAVHRGGEVQYVNPAGALLIGAETAARIVGTETAAFIHPDDRDRWYRRRVDGQSVHLRLLRLDGSIREVEAVSAETEFGGARAVQTVFRDVTEQRRLEARLVHEAFHDSLTALANRALFRDRVEHAIVMRQRDPAHQTAVLFLDLDDFKEINDQFGHEAGDRVLQEVAARLKRETRATDTVARLGGDEFAVLLEHFPGEHEVLLVVQRIRMALAVPLQVEQRSVTLSASIGVAFGRTAEDVDTLLRNADVAMYEAKEAGKARHAIFEPAMYDAIVQRLQLEADLRAAVLSPESSWLSLVYQPIVDLATGELRSLEALLRWTHPTRGVIPPSVFVPIAEQTGAIVELGWWVLATVCAQLVEWRGAWWRTRRSMERFPTVSVNISGRQLSDEQFVARFRSIVEQCAAPASQLILEITETVIMRDTDRTLQTLSELKALGVRLAIDDFGTGYSSLSYLQRFPVDVLKIDRAFVHGLAAAGHDAALARTIITLGQSLGLRTVAEGIETVAQMRALQEMGCEYGQGFLFSHPLAPGALSSWLDLETRDAFPGQRRVV